jgi:archaellum biogenesis ATPase FlaH
MAMSIYHFNPEDAYRFGQEQNIKVYARGDELQFKQCPYCRKNTTKQYKFAINLKTGQFKCLRASCGAHGNMITLSKDFDFSLGNDVDEYYRGIKQFRNIHKKNKPLPKPFAERYMQGRGISTEVTNKYHITVRNDRPTVLLFPFYDENDVLTFVKYRNTEPEAIEKYGKEYCESGCKPILFGMAQCDPEKSKRLTLTEGQIDSLSVAEAGIENAVSVPTGAKGFTWVPYCWDFLGKFNELVVFGDHENGHITLLEEMKSRFHGTIKHVREEDYKECKDANELLQRYGKQAVRAAVENAVLVPDAKIIPLASVARKDLSELEKFPSGIKALDRTIGGFYMGQLVVLTGERGEGKSTLASQFAGHALNAGYAVFFYSGELMDWYFRAWFDQQLAGPSHVNGKIDENGETEYCIDAEAQQVMSRWYANRMYLYNNDIVGENTEEVSLLSTVETAIKQYGCRVIFLDNLMTAIDYDSTSDIYMKQTVFVKELALMAKKFNVLIMLIAHPRKRTGMQFSNDDVAGSANVTNLADVVMRYARPEKKIPPKGKDGAGEDDLEESGSDRVLQVWKNRLTGKTNKGIQLFYDERSRRITDAKGLWNWKLEWEKDFDGKEDDGFLTVDDDFDGIPFD